MSLKVECCRLYGISFKTWPSEYKLWKQGITLNFLKKKFSILVPPVFGICINNKLDSTNLPDCYVTIHFKPSLTPIKEEEHIIKKEEPIPNKKNIRIINKFKHLYYSLKFKKHFIKLLKKSRERKTNKTNRIIIAILLIILVIVVIMLMMRNTKQYLSNKLPSSSTDTYEINISLMIYILHVISSVFWKLYWK